MTDEKNPFTFLPDVYKTLDLLNIAYVEADGYEADDYIATVCSRYNDKYDMTIVSTDSDFNQLIGEHVSIFKPRGKKSEFINVENLYEKLCVHPEQVVQYKALIGDTADNIPGIKGIGPKRAAEILSHGSIEAILRGDTTCPEKYSTKLEAHQELLERNIQLITMNHQVPFQLDEHQLEVSFDTAFKAYDVIKML